MKFKIISPKLFVYNLYNLYKSYKKTPKLTINQDGTKYWELPNGKLHREDSPAVEHTNGTKYWYIDNELHREDGPAIEYMSGHKSWYLNNIQYTEKEHKHKTRSIKLKKLL